MQIKLQLDVIQFKLLPPVPRIHSLSDFDLIQKYSKITMFLGHSTYMSTFFFLKTLLCPSILNRKINGTE